MDSYSRLPPLLRVPLEIRLQIYSYLLIGDTTDADTSVDLSARPDYYEYEKDPNAASTNSTDRKRVLSFRNSSPYHFRLATHQQNNLRSAYKIRSGRLRIECMDVTYNCVNPPKGIDPTFMGTNKQVHAEAARLLYTNYTFDFDTSIEAVIPFLTDLTPYSRSCIRRMSLVKKAIAYDKDFDRCEWANTCHYISRNLGLAHLDLGIVAGKPLQGAELIQQIPETEWNCLVNAHKKDEMQWCRDLMSIKGLNRLDVRACVEHCPPPMSSGLMFFVAFSASVGTGFRSWLLKQMIESPEAPKVAAAPVGLTAIAAGA